MKQLLNLMKLTLNFDEKEFTKQVELPADVRYNLTWLCQIYLEPLREAFGPIIINSGWRTAEENAKCGGAMNSYHLTGKAVDIRCDSLDDAIKKAAYLLCREDGLMINTNRIAELLISQNSRGSYWVHFALRKSMSDKKRLIAFMNYG